MPQSDVSSFHSAMFPARLSSLGQLAGFVDQSCGAAGMERDLRLRVMLIIEELFTNTVHHGHRGDCDLPVWISIRDDSGAAEIRYEDVAPPFNPFTHLADASESVEERPVGGIGVLLARALSSRREYSHVFGRNRIVLNLATSPRAER